MDIVENLAEWQTQFNKTWLQNYKETGEVNWRLYKRPRNTQSPSTPGIDLAQSKLMLISTAGGYLPASQPAFDAENDLGDYSIRTFASDTPASEIAFAHTHYDHAAVDADSQSLLPLQHLQDMVQAGQIGALSDVVSYSGYMPDVAQIVNETAPAIVAAAKAAGVQGALLVPA